MSISVSSQAGMSSFRLAANYARVFHGVAEGNYRCGRSVSRRPFQRRQVGILHVIPGPFLRCATIEEMEAEKSMIDKDAELSKVVAKQIEEGKVALRIVRQDALKTYEKLEKNALLLLSHEKKLSKDNVKDLSSDLQELTDDYTKKIDCLQAKSECI